jgi:hypothetical protein
MSVEESYGQGTKKKSVLIDFDGLENHISCASHRKFSFLTQNDIVHISRR